MIHAQLEAQAEVQKVAFDPLITMLPPVITHFTLLLTITLAAAVPALAQGESGKDTPPPRVDRDGRDGRPFGPSGPFGPGHGGPGHGGPGRGDDFSQLNEAERQKVRTALEKAWKTPEVEAARDRLMKANDEFRETMKKVIEKEDPEAAKILSKVKPSSPWDVMKDRGRLPNPEDPRFVDAAIGRMAMELHNFSKPEHRDAARKLHEKVMANPAMTEAVKRLRAAAPGERITLFKTMAENYRKEIEQEISILREKFRRAPPQPPGEAPAKE